MPPGRTPTTMATLAAIAAIVTAAAALVSSLAALVVLLRRTDKLEEQNGRIEHLVNSQLDDVTGRLAEVERELAIRTRERDDAERAVPGSRQAREEETR